MRHDLKGAVFALIDVNRRLNRAHPYFTVLIVFDINTIVNALQMYFRVFIVDYFENRAGCFY